MVLLVSPFKHCHKLWVGLSPKLWKCGSSACREGAEMQEGQEMQKSMAMVQLHVWWQYLLSKRHALLEWTAKMGRTDEQAGLLGSGERADHAAVIATDCRHWALQVVHA